MKTIQKKNRRLAKLKALKHVVRCNNCHIDYNPLEATQSVSGVIQCPRCGHYLRKEEYQK